MPGLIGAYFLSRNGQRSNYAMSATRQNLDLRLRLGTGRAHGGLTDATACSAAKRRILERRHRRVRAQTPLPIEVREQLLDAIYGGQHFHAALGDPGLTSNAS